MTATHVAEFLATHPDAIGVPLATGQKSNEAWTLGRSRLALSPEDAQDVAVLRLDEAAVVERFKNGGRVFLTDSDVAQNASGDDCIVFGWPQSQTSFAGGVVTGHPIALRVARITPPEPNRPTDIFLQWPAEPIPMLLGISGSPIWAIQTHAAPGVWAPSKDMRVIGVQHTIKEGRWIRGTNWTIVQRVIRELDAT